MAWIEKRQRKDGTVTYWIRDRRDGRQIVICGGATPEEAQRRRNSYEVRRDLEKEGYEDHYQAIVDQLFGKGKGTSHGMA